MSLNWGKLKNYCWNKTSPLKLKRPQQIIINYKHNIPKIRKEIKKIIDGPSYKIFKPNNIKQNSCTSNKVIKILRSINEQSYLNKKFRDIVL